MLFGGWGSKEGCENPKEDGKFSTAKEEGQGKTDVEFTQDVKAIGANPVVGTLLKLATRAKLHMGHLIYGSWYFSWIPLFERCRIDIKIILFRHIFMEIWIYLCYWQFVKVGQQTN